MTVAGVLAHELTLTGVTAMVMILSVAEPPQSEVASRTAGPDAQCRPAASV